MTTPSERHDLLLARLDSIVEEQRELKRCFHKMEVRIEHRLTKLETKATIKGALGGAVSALLAAIAAGIAYMIGR